MSSSLTVSPDVELMSRYTRVPRATAISTSPDTERTDVEPAATDPIWTSPETVARRTEPATVPSETSPEALLPPTSRPTSRTRASPDAELNESAPPTAAPTRSPLATVTLTSPSTSSKRQLPDPLRNDSEPIRPMMSRSAEPVSHATTVPIGTVRSTRISVPPQPNSLPRSRYSIARRCPP